MKNAEVFNDYDMVVCMTQKTINDQLTHLTRMGIIRSELILVQKVDRKTRSYVYDVLDSSDQLPTDGNTAYIDGFITPQVSITDSGTSLTFVLSFRSGTANLWQGSGPLAELVQYDMTGWKYGIPVFLDLKAVEKEDIAKNLKVPDLVKQQLYSFTSNLFTVNHLFMDFESTDLMRFDPSHTDTKSAGDEGIQALAQFMSFYLKWLVSSGNPYILGYSLTTTDRTNYDPDQNVPDSLRPVGTTYSMYFDPKYPDLSNLNFVLATKGGHKSIAGTPGNFDTNWISPTDQCDAKMIYSHTCLIEQFFLRPFFDQLRTGVYNQIKDQINIEGNDYDHAKAATATGYKYTIANQTAGDDQYTNIWTADLVTKASTVVINLAGDLIFYKHVDRNMGVCQATAWASGSLSWTSSITLSVSKNKQGQPSLAVSQSPVSITNSKQDSSQNDCAKGFAVIGKILGTILDALTFFQDKGFFSNLIDKAFDLHTPGIGNVGAVFNNLGNSIGTVIILPAGQVFFFKTPAIDSLGNLAMQLTYKAEN